MILESLFAKLVGKEISNKIDLKEGPVGPTIPWYKSKTIWSDVVTILISMYGMLGNSIAPDLHFHLPAIPGMLLTILGALGIYGRTTATQQIG